MFWRVISEECAEPAAGATADGRFVLHRHQDAAGDHLDLRLEQDGYLLGWRIAAEAIEGEPWATEKAPHSARWLDHDGAAERVDAGTYAWIERGPDRRVMVLRGRDGARQVRIERQEAFGVDAARAICGALDRSGADVRDAARLIEDGVTARRRALGRLCGLGQELDGSAFDAEVWRKTLGPMSLDEIQAQLRAYEVRFDRKYPASPVSRPEKLGDGDSGDRAATAITIARDGE